VSVLSECVNTRATAFVNYIVFSSSAILRYRCGRAATAAAAAAAAASAVETPEPSNGRKSHTKKHYSIMLSANIVSFLTRSGIAAAAAATASVYLPLDPL
jgi:hypothetical protein